MLHYQAACRMDALLAFRLDKTYLATDEQTSCWHRSQASGVPSTVASPYVHLLAHRYVQESHKLAKYDHKAHHPCRANVGTQSLYVHSWS